MKFTNTFSICVVLASVLTLVTALPVDNTGLIAREAYRSSTGRVPFAYARSFEELDARDPLFGIKFPKLPFPIPRLPIPRLPIPKLPIPKLPFQFWRRDLEDDFVNAVLNSRAPDAGDDFLNAILNSRAPDADDDLADFLGSLSKRDFELDERAIDPNMVINLVKAAPGVIKTVAPIVKNVWSAIKKWKFWRRDLGDDLVTAILESRDADDDFAQLLNELSKRDFELDERAIDPNMVISLVKAAPGVIKTVAPIVKNVWSAIKKWKFWRRDLSDEHVARFISDIVNELSRRDDDDDLAELFSAVRRELEL